MSDWLTGIGLAINMAGTIAVYFFGFPQPDFRGEAITLVSSPSEEELEQARARRRRQSYIGVALLFVGFTLQLVGLVLDD